jgi:hypothetical protein
MTRLHLVTFISAITRQFHRIVLMLFEDIAGPS